ncbi:toll/interleukin-1 receptor domain-containing protein [Streptomyces sp. LP11]|uniref:Toll/interleukin-1 receptor domain-containing protein n=1 Tax=Streptomyces pyxinicus TaxID=2970331 RepID=A0ABT2B7M1_9ACTN|nr:toll/interleukin-1 receptor domain-containing protein [Streptomyces sp. LP11]MCS0604523.1 toll/interleukin-1 receptor domain-containing protein [Streptomyces sp. LP11]
MHEIFLNYRTDGGKPLAYVCHGVLEDRFGEGSVFLARKSIAEGTDFADALLRGARSCHVLLALIDEKWLNAPDRHQLGRRALDNPDDWVRREIEEALTSGALVVPLFMSRKVEQLDPRSLPRTLAELAECQYTRVGLATHEADLTRLADSLVRRIPALAALDRAPVREDAENLRQGPQMHTERQSGGIGNVGGSVGTYVHEAHAPFHSGRGDIYDGPRISGDGTNYVAGDNHGGIRQGFGTRTPRGGVER